MAPRMYNRLRASFRLMLAAATFYTESLCPYIPRN